MNAESWALLRFPRITLNPQQAPKGTYRFRVLIRINCWTGLVEMAMAYSRSRMLCAAARLGKDYFDELLERIRSIRASEHSTALERFQLKC